MNNNSIKCQFCGYTPPSDEQPSSGTWFCPRCGKRIRISQPVNLSQKSFTQKKRNRRTSRDQISNQIYSKMTKKTSTNHGLKEKYLNPKIDPITPRTRKGIRIFSKKRFKDDAS